jgi:hypothetical protein
VGGAQWISVLPRIEVLVHGIDRTHRQSPRYSRLLKSQTEFQQKWVSPPAPRNSFGVRLRARCLRISLGLALSLAAQIGKQDPDLALVV